MRPTSFARIQTAPEGNCYMPKLQEMTTETYDAWRRHLAVARRQDVGNLQIPVDLTNSAPNNDIHYRPTHPILINADQLEYFLDAVNHMRTDNRDNEKANAYDALKAVLRGLME